jgi:hypothetical protein
VTLAEGEWPTTSLAESLLRGGRAPPRDHIDGSGDDIGDVVHGFDWGLIAGREHRAVAAPAW